MKKDQKIIEIRTSAKVKLEDMKAKMKTAIARAAQMHADILAGRTDKCDNERVNEIERFKAEKLAIEAGFYQERAALYAETETACKEATDDQEEEKPQQVQEPTVWLDGSQHSAVITARRILNKLPRLNFPQESFYFEISPLFYGGTNLDIRYINTIDKEKGICSCEMSAKDEPEIQAARVDIWLKSVDVLMAKAKALKEAEVVRKEGENE